MSMFLTYNEVDTDIQRRMASATPNQAVRLQAINSGVQDIYAKYDVDTGRRSTVLYVVPNGEPVSLSGVSDFKHIADLRYLAPTRHYDEFSYREDDLFSEHIGEGMETDEYSVPYNNGDLFLRVNSRDGYQSKVLHNMNSLTSNGTWSASDDGVSLTTTTVTTLEQSETIQFGITVATSGNNYATLTNSTISSLDFTDYLGLGKFRSWIYIPSVTNFTSVTLRWGSSASAYYSVTATTQIDGSSFVAGWNRIEWDWASASTTGSPTITAITYALVRLNYTASYTDQTGVRIEKIEAFLPIPLKMVYFTYHLSQTTSGTFQEELTTTATDELLLPKRFRTLVTLAALKYLLPVALGDDSMNMLAKVSAEYNNEEKNLGLDLGNKIKSAAKKVKLHSFY